MSTDLKEKMQEYFDKIRQIALFKAFLFKIVLFGTLITTTGLAGGLL